MAPSMGVESARMSTDQLIDRGDFEGALNELRAITSASTADPAQLLVRFNMEARLALFDEAEQTMQRLCAAAPQVAPVMGPLGLAARAERLATERLTNPQLATRRATVDLPAPQQMAYVAAALHHAEGNHPAAVQAIAQGKSLTPPTSGSITRRGGATQAFTAITDSDELTGASIPCYDGQSLLDLAYGEIRSITFAEPKISFDMMWRPAEVLHVTGRVLHVRIPALYPGTGRASGAGLRTGSETSWDRRNGYAVALGQRDLMLTTPSGGQAIVGFLGITSMTFDNPMRAPVGGAGPRPLQDLAWPMAQKAAAAYVGFALFFFFFGIRFLFAIDLDIRWPVFAFGLSATAATAWLVTQRAGRLAGGIAAAVFFALTTLKWLL